MAGKVLILIDHFATGGAARVTSTLLPGLLEYGFDVNLALDNVNCDVFYEIPQGVHQISFEAKKDGRPGLKQVSLIYSARRIIKEIRPDVIIAVTFFPFFYARYASLGLGIPVIAYDHTSFGRKMGRFVNFIRYHLYGRADRLVILTHKDERLLGRKFPRKTVIYNPLTYPISRISVNREKTVLCAGRLDSWQVKGLDRMIDIWSRVVDNFPDWKLQIAGSGDERSMTELESMVREAGVADSVEFLGHVHNMPALYARTPIFALPSRVEGFPMVLLEAMSQGCVCVSFEMGGAVKEMMGPCSGEIVPDADIDGFRNSLSKLMSEYPDYSGRQECGYSDAARFSCGEYYCLWNQLLKETIK